MATTRTHFRTCNLCEAMCGLRIDVRGDEILSIRGDEQDAFSNGHICPKATALQDLHEDPDRLRTPMRRTGDRWEPIGWKEALHEAAAGIHRVQEEHGNNAFGLYLGNPNVHNTSATMSAPLFSKALRSKNRFAATSVDQLPHMLAAYLMFGHQILLPVPDIDRTDYMLMLGANPLASNGSLMTAPGIRKRIEALQARGGTLVVVDPRRTETAGLADAHHFIKPGTDAFFLIALIHAIRAIDGIELGSAREYTTRVEEVLTAIERFSITECAAACGISTDNIRKIARDFCSAKSAICYGRLGTCTQRFGGLSAWLLNVVNILTGNLDRPGGVMFTKPAVDLLQSIGDAGIGRGHFARWKSRVRGLPEFGGELPAAVMAEEMLTPGEGQIRGFMTLAGNPVLSTPNGNQLDRALGQLDFMISVDPYINETTRHAHLILPPVSPLERSHYDLVFHLLAVRNTAKFAPPLFEPPANGRTDGQILLSILRELEKKRHGRLHPKTVTAAALDKVGTDRLLDAALRMGPYGTGRGGLSLRRLRKNPHGIDLGPLEPALPERLPLGKVDLGPEAFIDDLERLHRSISTQSDGLLLIGRRHVRSNNSWMHNSKRLVRGRDRCTLMMHPDNAEALGLEATKEVEIRSNSGVVIAPLEVTDAIMKGVVSLPHGFGHDREGVRLDVARQQPGVSANDLTDDAAVDPMSGTAALNGGTMVEVRAVDARATATEESRNNSAAQL